MAIRRTWLALACLVALGLIWGISSSVSKWVALAGVHPLAYAFWQCTIAALVLWLIAIARGTYPPVDARHLGYYAFTGVIGLALPGFNMYLAIAHIPAGLMSVVIAAAPILTYALALLVGTERLVAMRLAGVVLGLSGTLLLLGPRGSLPDPSMAIWVLVALITPALYAVSAVFAGRFMPRQTDALAIAAGMIAMASAVFGALMLATGIRFVPWPWDAPGVLAVWWHGVSSAAAYALYFQIIRLAGPVYMSQVGYIVVAVGVVTGMIIYGERHSMWVWAGMATMLVGLTLVNLGQKRAR